MDSSVSISRPVVSRDQPLRVWLPQVLLLCYLVLVLVTFAVLPSLALGWLGVPSDGLLVGPGAVVLHVLPGSEAFQAGVRAGDRLVELNGAALSTFQAYNKLLAGAAEGPIALRVVHPDGRNLELTVVVGVLPARVTPTLIYVPFLVGLIFLGSAVWTFAVRRTRPSGQILVLCFTSVAVLTGCLFDFYTSQVLSGLWVIALALAASALFWLGLYFPNEDPLVRRYPMITGLFFIVSLLLGVNSLLRWLGLLDPAGFLLGVKLQLGLMAGTMLFWLAWTDVRRRRSKAAIERDQLRFSLVASVVCFGPVLVWLAWSLVTSSSGYPDGFVLFPLVIFPMMMGYTIQRYRLQQTDYILSRGLLYSMLSIAIALSYALVVAGMALVLGRFFTRFNPLVNGLTLILLALAFNPLRERLQGAVDTVFFRGEGAFQDRLQTFSGELTRSVELPAILKTLRQYISDTLLPNRLHIYVYDSFSDRYIATPGSDNRPTSDLHFASNGPFVGMLSGRRGPLVLPEQYTIPATLLAEKSRLALLNAEVYLPLNGRARLSGWIALGQRLSGEPYSPQELSFLESLCDQAALAIERAQVIANMENRVRQMNVLARVAQGVNITLAMDDVLELIYAQTTSVIPADEFQIMLYDTFLETYQYIFYQLGDERLTERENSAVPARKALEQEVVRLRKAIRTDDYNRECQRQSITGDRPGLFAWMGIPLNAGAETIGALSLGTHDTHIQYTNEQRDLGQAIADQVAGAIVKARLLQETERRALQLTTLNDVTRQLTSTLELEPLLQNILQSAVDILSCEAGSLLLVDDTTDELVFRVVVSPVATDLLNRRLPPGVGVVGVAVKSCKPVVVNDVNRFPEWFSKTDQQTGFITHALLVIPLLLKERVIGVIEVINKKDGSPYSQDDQDLLAAFAAQAAVAIENARLYTMTDQALASRVEELSVMQRIDRELNTSLDIATAMRITLDWALRQSGVQAGLIGTLDEMNLQVMASNGYLNELEEFGGEVVALDRLALNEVARDGTPLRRTLVGDGQSKNLLAYARSQAIVPIRRETTSIGLLFLESVSSQAISEDTLNFLVRLCDHASIAIFNSQLYAAVQSANLAKSEFVSLVAHELKNPMTSVKGYTELLASGAVGSINEAQGNFLNTIRSNIERMNTLVSDLNDMAKIEVGRLRMDFKAIPLAEVIDSVIRSTRRQVDEKQQKLNVDLSSDLPPAWADRTRLEQILVNLVSNAHKYTPAGGTIWVSAERAANQWSKDGGAEVLHIWVRDNGLGISPEDQTKIFQKFFRSEDPKSREAPGTGLGLNITRSLVEMQGGKIWFESEFRQGTTFHFTIPISAA